MSTDIQTSQDTRLGGFGHSADEDAQTAGLDAPAQFVEEHHEHVDGSGYPAGLRGEEIALESRIIHVADAFVAMTLDCPYRRALTRDEAIGELVRHRETQFDPAVVDALLALEARDDMAAAA